MVVYGLWKEPIIRGENPCMQERTCKKRYQPRFNLEIYVRWQTSQVHNFAAPWDHSNSEIVSSYFLFHCKHFFKVSLTGLKGKMMPPGRLKVTSVCILKYTSCTMSDLICCKLGLDVLLVFNQDTDCSEITIPRLARSSHSIQFSVWIWDLSL